MSEISSRPIPSPEDITCPDAIIKGWLDNWNKGNIDPVELDDLDDITYDFIYRAVDYGANQELHRCLMYLLTVAENPNEIVTKLWKKRRPAEASEDEFDFKLAQIKELQKFLQDQITALKK